MTAMTRDAVARVLGPVDDAFAAEIVATGASEAELREARAWVADDEALVNDLRPFPTGRVAVLVELLRPLEGPVVVED